MSRLISSILSCILAGLTTNPNAWAQTTGWVSGYIVTEGGDTLRGELYNRDWTITPDQVSFRQNKETEARSYNMPQIQAFYFQPSQEGYIRLTARLDKTPVKTGNLQPSNQIVWSEETVFAQQVVRGLVSLAMHRDEDGKPHYLVQRNTDAWQDLILLKYMPEAGQVVTVERYRQQLGSLTYDCPAIKNRLPNLAFSQTALQSFVTAYNTCQTGQAGSYQQSALKSTVEWGLLAGASVSQLAIRIPASPDYFQGQPYRYTGTVQPNIGIWLNYFLTRNRQQWSLYNDLHFQRSAVTGTWSGNASQLSGQFTYSYLKLHTGFRWQLPKTSIIKPFAMLGISNGFAVAHQQTIRANQLNRTYEQALFGAVGLRAGRFLGEIRYERGNGMDTDNAVLTSTQTAYILLSFIL